MVEYKVVELAYDLYNLKIKRSKEKETNETIDKSVKETVRELRNYFDEGKEEEASKELEEKLYSLISIERKEEEAAIILGDEAKESKWWTEYKDKNSDKLCFWMRYREYLANEKLWKKSMITRSIDSTTDTIMNSIANPIANVADEKRAMVVGYVQSGKTANYIGLINKALDAGYKYIIILAGVHNNLRSQTQSRIDEEVLGYETSSIAKQKQRERAEKNKIGVGKKYDAKFVQTLTFRDEDGDFKKNRSGISTSPDVPTIIVTKKLKSTLENLIYYIESNSEVCKDENTGRFYMSAKYPLLLIDDEADQASVNTGYNYESDGKITDENDVKTINKLIRKLFIHFETRSYVGYTATPYANIFIPNNIKDAKDELGNDLFPADCIVSLPKPSNYIGANEFFGYGKEDETDPMPLVRKIKDSDFIDKKKKIVGEIPKSLEKAIKSFLIAIAIRNTRLGKNNYKPNTMLIHVERLKNMHSQLERKIRDYYDDLQNMIIDGDKETKESIYKIIEDDYIPTTKEMIEKFSKYMEDSSLYDKDKIYREIIRLVSDDKIKIKVINGDSEDSLEYKENQNKEYNVIAIGGDKFSRGLTLEGLSITYFTRETKYYDTLMQMGRWFGFRPKYADLCRVFIPNDLYRYFARIAFATDNLREQIEYMSEKGLKPQDFGLRVATHPELKISNPQKIKTGIIEHLDFSNTLTVFRDIDVNLEQYRENYDTIEQLFKEAEKIYSSEEHFNRLGRKKVGNHYFLEDIPGIRIVKFLKEFKTSIRANKINGLNIAKYIEEQLEDDYLSTWTVALINTGDDGNLTIAGTHIGNGITRFKENSINYFEDKKVCSIKMLKSKDHEYMSMTKEEYEKAMEIKANAKENAKDTAYKIREIMDKKRGFMIIYPIDHMKKNSKTEYFKIGDGNHVPPFGLVFVFPEGNGKSITYKLNPIAASQEENYALFD